MLILYALLAYMILLWRYADLFWGNGGIYVHLYKNLHIQCKDVATLFLYFYLLCLFLLSFTINGLINMENVEEM